MYLLNKLNERGLKYEIQTKEYHWNHFEDTPLKAKGSGECLGIHIIVTLNDRYKVSIIQAFQEALGEFYGDDIWDIAFVDTVNGDWYLLKVFETGAEGLFSNAQICEGRECIEHIEKFIKDRGLNV